MGAVASGSLLLLFNCRDQDYVSSTEMVIVAILKALTHKSPEETKGKL
jgi:hypothetical protein